MSYSHPLCCPQFKSDVVGCSIDATTEGLVLVVDTFNPDSDRTNVLDDSEQSTQGHPVPL